MDKNLDSAGLSDEALDPEDEDSPYRGEKGKFLHQKLARDLIDEQHAKFIDGMPAIWDGLAGRYAIGYEAWDRATARACYGTTIRQRREVREALRMFAPREEQGDPHLIACANGVVNPWVDGYDELDADGHSDGFLLNEPRYNIVNVLPVEWNPSAYDADTDEALDAFACGDPDTRLNIEEIIAACTYRGRETQNMAVLVGLAGNGKSTFLHMLARYLGADNVAHVDMRNIGARFFQAPLVGRLANLGDDISNKIVGSNELAVLKKVVTGDLLTVEEKNLPAFTARPYCSLVFSANEFPRLGDFSDGMLDRIFAVRFAANFRHDAERRVTNMEAVLDTEASRSYMLNIALRRLPDLVRRGGYTPTPFSVSTRDSVLLDNDSVAYWLAYADMRQLDVEGRTVDEIYKRYRDFCEGAGRSPVEQRAFTRRVNARMGTITEKDTCIGGRQVRTFHARRAG